MYSSLALSYRQWHYRMTSVQTEKPGGPAIGLSAFHAMNIFSLLMLLPVMPDWIFVGTPLVVGVCAFVVVSRIYRAHPSELHYAKLSDNVPGLREFPLVYAYLFGTLALLVICVYTAIHRAA